ncbi:MAG: hypothetical protein ACRDNF_26730 [Streptosporangiaceae bacterium]
MLAVTAAATTAAPAWASSSDLQVTALSFAKSTVNATTGVAKVGLTWTITDSASTATAIKGDIYLGVPGSTPGTFASGTFKVAFQLGKKYPVSSSGTAQDSTYEYKFPVPEYAQETPAAWQVYELTAQDNAGNQLDLTGSGLSAFGAVLTAKEVVATSPPTYQDLSLYENESPVRPYLYVAPGKPDDAIYQFTVQDYPAGFSSGSIQVTGPGGVTITKNFAYKPKTQQCGYFGGGGPTDITCGVVVTYPGDSAAGTWAVSTLTLTDAAGNTATFTDLDGAPITVTSDQVVKATDFKANPNPVNDWAPFQFFTVNVSMTVSGASDGVSAVYVDTDSEGGECTQTDSTPTVNGNTVTVPLRVSSGMSLCQVTGIAVVDGAGNVSLYGQEYAPAPDPYLLIRQLPDTIPPTATSASLDPASISSTQTPVTLTIDVDTPIAPVNGLDIYVYNSKGKQVDEEGGGATENDGVVTGQVPLPNSLPPGVYTIGFTITDAGYLSTSYGPGANPMPGGPLLLTVT